MFDGKWSKKLFWIMAAEANQCSMWVEFPFLWWLNCCHHEIDIVSNKSEPLSLCDCQCTSCSLKWPPICSWTLFSVAWETVTPNVCSLSNTYSRNIIQITWFYFEIFLNIDIFLIIINIFKLFYWNIFTLLLLQLYILSQYDNILHVY